MKKLRQYIALFLLSVLSVFIVPKEIIHELHGTHHDTIDRRDLIGNHLEEAHQHCMVLQLSKPEYAGEIKSSASSLEFIWETLFPLVKDFPYYTITSVLFLRGPPQSA